MAAGTFLVIGLVGLVLLAISAFLGGDDADIDTDTDIDFDIDTDADMDVDGEVDVAHGAGGGGDILQWFSIKAMSVAAVGFGFVGWALTSQGTAVALVWIVAGLVGGGLWVMAVLWLFPWIREQQGDDLQPLSAYQGLTAEVVVRIPADGIGTVQFKDPNGAVIRRSARSVHHNHEVVVGKKVVIVLANAESVVVDEFSLLEEPN